LVSTGSSHRRFRPIRPDPARRCPADHGLIWTVSENNPVQNVTFPSNGTIAHGHLALPESGSAPASW
jgi:hypothetical protein